MVADRIEAEEKRRLLRGDYRNLDEEKEEAIENIENILNQIRFKSNPEALANIEQVLSEIKEKTLIKLALARQ